eukprot:Hpha_TRINITY_DN27115_c0_g1::TRINITY_DN27115_c0_g1_i1::g.29326::m.29326
MFLVPCLRFGWRPIVRQLRCSAVALVGEARSTEPGFSGRVGGIEWPSLPVGDLAHWTDWECHAYLRYGYSTVLRELHAELGTGRPSHVNLRTTVLRRMVRDLREMESR